MKIKKPLPSKGRKKFAVPPLLAMLMPSWPGKQALSTLLTVGNRSFLFVLPFRRKTPGLPSAATIQRSLPAKDFPLLMASLPTLPTQRHHYQTEPILPNYYQLRQERVHLNHSPFLNSNHPLSLLCKLPIMSDH